MSVTQVQCGGKYGRDHQRQSVGYHLFQLFSFKRKPEMFPVNRYKCKKCNKMSPEQCIIDTFESQFFETHEP